MGPHVFINNGNVYSVDMMIAYINIFKPKSKSICIDNFIPILETKVWKERKKDRGYCHYSPMEVISDPRKYDKQIDRIGDADLNYPIIVEKTRTEEYPVIDGIHRIMKALISGKKRVDVYEMGPSDLKKCLIGKTNTWGKIDNLKGHNYIKLFYDRFCK